MVSIDGMIKNSSIKNSSGILHDVARIARVPDAHRASFVRLLGDAITRAEKDSVRPAGKNVSAGILHRDFFDPIIRAAGALRLGLQRLGGDHLKAGEDGRSMTASSFFGEVLRVRTKTDDADHGIADLIVSLNLDLVIESAERASERAKTWLSKPGRKKGTGNAAFDMFVMSLLALAEHPGGKLTIYRTSYEDVRWSGSLLTAVQRLRPILPQTNFLPASKLGYSLHNVYQRWRVELGAPRRKKLGNRAKSK